MSKSKRAALIGRSFYLAALRNKHGTKFAQTPLYRGGRTKTVRRDLEGKMQSKVLLVEDNQDNRALMKVFLEMYGMDVTEASDGYEAVEKAVASPPDLVLMDIAMPVLDGVKVAAVMRQHESLH